MAGEQARSGPTSGTGQCIRHWSADGANAMLGLR
jgi:hypothetical protein